MSVFQRPGHDVKVHPHRVLALYDLDVDGPLSNRSINQSINQSKAEWRASNPKQGKNGPNVSRRRCYHPSTADPNDSTQSQI